MKTQVWFILLITTVLLMPITDAFAAFKFEGVDRCAFCHRKASTGDQFGVWSKKGHSKAYKSLASAEAKKLASSVGVMGNPQEAKECLICHAKSQYDKKGNPYPTSQFKKKYSIEDGVQCEDCHGPGEKYRKKKTMKKIRKEGGAAVSATAKQTGLLVPDEKVCKGCHVPEITIGGATYKNPTYQAFDYQKRVEEIAHPIPE